jgi:hypothetical protein
LAERIGGFTKPPRRRYPWNEWQDGSVWRIQTMQMTLYERQTDTRRVKTSKLDDSTLEFQFQGS